MQEANNYVGVIVGLITIIGLLIRAGWLMFKNLLNKMVIGEVQAELKPIHGFVEKIGTEVGKLSQQVRDHEKRVITDHPTIPQMNSKFDEVKSLLTDIQHEISEEKNQTIQDLKLENRRLKDKLT